MKKLFPLLGLTAVLGLNGCSGSSDRTEEIPFVRFDEPVSLKGYVYPRELIINPPSQIELIDSVLFLFRPGGCTARLIDPRDATDIGPSTGRDVL